METVLLALGASALLVAIITVAAYVSPSSVLQSLRSAATAIRGRVRDPDASPWIVYVVVLLAVTGATSGLLASGVVGQKTVETERPDNSGVAAPADDLTLQERKTETSVPVVTSLTAMLAGGWLALPLKYLWDERAKRNEFRRQITGDMLEKVHKLSEQFYTPEIHRIYHIAAGARRLAGEEPPGRWDPATNMRKEASFRRLLYAVCRYHGFSHSISSSMLFFRSRDHEETVREGLSDLHDLLTRGLDHAPDADAVLARAALREGSPEEHMDPMKNEVDFIEFAKRLDGSSSDWARLQEFARTLREHYAKSEVLNEIVKSASSVAEIFDNAVADVYREWYERA